MDKLFEVEHNATLTQSFLGRSVASTWPLAVSNAFMICCCHVNPLGAIDYDCTCGDCVKCEATINMLDHQLNVMYYGTRNFFKKVHVECTDDECELDYDNEPKLVFQKPKEMMAAVAEVAASMPNMFKAPMAAAALLP